MRGPCATALLEDLPLEVENYERRQWADSVEKLDVGADVEVAVVRWTVMLALSGALLGR